MPIQTKESLLQLPISDLSVSTELKLVFEVLGFYTLSDLRTHKTEDLLKLPGFSQNLLYEYVYFMGKNELDHYIDP